MLVFVWLVIIAGILLALTRLARGVRDHWPPEQDQPRPGTPTDPHPIDLMI